MHRSFRLATPALLASALLSAAPPAAHAQWSDNLDSYPTGLLNGPGGWKGWDNDPFVCGVITTDQARSQPNSMFIPVAVGDPIREFAGVTAGAWTLAMWVYVPSAFNSSANFLIYDNYNDFGPYEHCVWVEFDSFTNTVRDFESLRPMQDPQPLVRDA